MIVSFGCFSMEVISPPAQMILNGMAKNKSIVNHFIPFTEEDDDAPDRFESDFMVKYLSNKKRIQ